MGIRIIAVGVTDQVDTDLLLDIVSNPDTDYFPVENFADLSDILDTIVDEVVCRRFFYVVKVSLTPCLS